MQHTQSVHVVIDAREPNARYWRDLWDFRELVYFLTWRDILVRYKQTTIGVLWTLIRPLLVMLALSLVFGRIANLASQTTVPYPLLVLAALLPWQFFANSLMEGSESLVSNSNLITKIYFPRLLIPISSLLVALCDFFISFIILMGVMAYYQFAPTWNLLALPLFVAHLTCLAFGISLWISSLNVKYRDFRYIIPFCVQFGLYITPVGFSSNLIPETWRWIYSLNPLVGIIDAFRWAILGSSAPFYFISWAESLLLTVLILSSGVAFFRKGERHFADII
jgi:lipopolysaccharide transport system permease protein